MQNLYEPSGRQRIQSIDILRGVIMLIMALDHTRDFFHHAGINSDPTDLASTTPFLFFTRWITHFCAPTFIFLSGISANLAGKKRTKQELSAFLIRRGAWLILVELILLSLAFTANPLYNTFILQVLWAIGVSMIILGLLVRAPMPLIAALGALIFFGHDILDFLQLPKTGLGSDLIRLFLTSHGSLIELNANHFVFDLYAIIPWTGIMLLGYVFGAMYQPTFQADRRKKMLLFGGLSALALFVLLRFINVYGDPAPWAGQRTAVFTLLSFLNVSKYPPSLLYSLMTVGTALLVLSQTERIQNRLTAIFVVYGSVPFFYYILHFYLLRLLTIVVFFASGYHTNQIIPPNSGFLFLPKGFGFSIGIVYLIWFGVVATLYFPCKWFSKYKQTHNQWWLSYL